MKKLMTMFLAVVLCMGLAVPAFAADGYEEVTIEYEDPFGYGTMAQVKLDQAKVVTTSWGSISHYEVPAQVQVTVTLYERSSEQFREQYQIALRWFNAEFYESGSSAWTDVAYALMTPTGELTEYTAGPSSEDYDSHQLLPNQPYTFTVQADRSDAVVLGCGLRHDLFLLDGVQLRYAGGSAEQPTTPSEPEQPSEPSQPEQPSTPSEPEQPSQPTTPAEPERPAGTVTYTVKKGDTLGFITTNYYGSNAQRNALYKANADAFKATSGKLVEGMTLVIPETLGGVKRIAAPVPAEGESLYTVQAGDTLSKIAQSVYGDMWQYKAIFERNSDRLKNANTIYEGQVIVLPAK